MNIGAIITATVVVAAVGLFIGIFLSVAGKKLCLLKQMNVKLQFVKPFRETTAVAADIPAVTVWQLQSQKAKHLSMPVR